MDMSVSVPAHSVERVIPLSQLRLSPRNVRKDAHKHDKNEAKQAIKALAASIHEVGLLQNIVVTEAEPAVFHVEAGSRRYKALQLLLKEKKISADHGVRCLQVPDAAAVTASLTENVQRQDMHPADEFEAFQALIAEGQSIEDIAAKFGVTTLVVQRRLKLANVSPRILNAYRANEANLEQLMALAITDDHKAQEAVFFNVPDWQRRPNEIRARLTEADVEASRDKVAKFVGLDTYLAAGGSTRRDLFAEGDKGTYLCDRELLDRLATDKLAATIEAVGGEGWSWTESTLRMNSSDLHSWTRVPTSKRKATAEEREQIQAVQQEIKSLQDQFDAMEDDADIDVYDRLTEQQDEARERLQALQGGLEVVAKKWHAVAGAIVTIDDNGIVVHRGLVREADLKKYKALQKDKPKGQGAAADPDDEPPAKAVHSEALTRRLTAQRTAAMQIELARNPRVALAAILQPLVLRCLGSGYGWGHESAVKVTCTVQEQLTRFAPELEQSEVRAQFTELQGQWTSRLPCNDDGELDADRLFATLLALEMDELTELLALCAASSLDTVIAREGHDHATALVAALGLDMSRYWTATADSYFNHVSKARTMEVVAEIAPDQVPRLEGMKKAELCAEAEKLAEGHRWLPTLLK